MGVSIIGIVFIFSILSLFLPQTVSAHAFGQLYNLPVPFWMYLYGGSAAIVLSFLIIGLFVNKQTYSTVYIKVQVRFLKSISTFWSIFFVKFISILFFFLILSTGFTGKDDSTNNISMTLFWIIFVLGVSYFIGIFGNMWGVISPIKIIADFFGYFLEKGLVRYPKQLGYYPALIFYFLFIWIELFGDTTPFTLATLLTIYFFIQFIGMVLFGKNNWLQYGEFFSIFFRLLGKMGVFEIRKNTLYLRVPFSGLLEQQADRFSLVLFILFMLSSTAFDGLSGISLWEQLYLFSYDLFGLLWEEHLLFVFNIGGLLVSLGIFLLLYVGFLLMTKVITRTKKSIMDLLLQFGFSLIPIAFAYNVAHYFTLLITEGQNMYRLISDPYGYGWNLFGTRGDFDIFIPDVNIIWHMQVGIILLGHIAGVYIAHLIALKVFPNHRQALLSQIPLLILMIMYTMIGLWILSQPITSEM